ncbi:hypothetical protein [Endozoicomonas sp.]|uniref:hypothetical protein n=1 Tax=Endozoicomonas sp. TaxID=1892382 RepID=UPI002883F29B|nr:hypothetical protein [Endozoicomonas sp.]
MLYEEKKCTPYEIEELLKRHRDVNRPKKLIANLLQEQFDSKQPQDHIIKQWLELCPIQDFNIEEAQKIKAAISTQLQNAVDQNLPDLASKWAALCPIKDLKPQDAVNIRSRIKTQLLKAVDQNLPDLAKGWIELCPIADFGAQNAGQIRPEIITQVNNMVDKNQPAKAWEWIKLCPREDYVAHEEQTKSKIITKVLELVDLNQPDLVSQWFEQFPLKHFNHEDNVKIKNSINAQLQKSAEKNLLTKVMGWIKLDGKMDLTKLDEAMIRSAKAKRQDLADIWIKQGANEFILEYWQINLEHAVTDNQPDRAEECIRYNAKANNLLLSAGLTKSADENRPDLAKKWLALGALKDIVILNRGLEKAIEQNDYQKAEEWLLIGADKNLACLKKAMKNIPFDKRALWLKQGIIHPQQDVLNSYANDALAGRQPTLVSLFMRFGGIPDLEKLETAVSEPSSNNPQSTSNKRKLEARAWMTIKNKMSRMVRKANLQHNQSHAPT